MSATIPFSAFDLARQVCAFVVGLGLIVWGTARVGFDFDAVLTGFILVGIAPVDRYVGLEMVR